MAIMRPRYEWIKRISSFCVPKATPGTLFIFGLASGVISTLISLQPQLVFSSLLYSPQAEALAPPVNLSLLPSKTQLLDKPHKAPLNQEVQKNFKLALTDPDNRISKEFDLPKPFLRRTSFWFDVYTKWGEETHIIHHASYPWIIFDIVSTSHIQKSKAHKWTKYHRSKKYVKNKRAKVRASLKRLLKRKNYQNLRGLDKRVFSKLRAIKGPRKRVLKGALLNLRSQLGQKDFILKGLKNSQKYLPQMEEIFASQGLPTELTRLPFVESSFNENAQSKVGASGIWQIMPRVGAASFIVNKYIDERNSPLKATLLAAKIFKQNKRILKSWPLAISAYNHGAYGIKKALKRSKSQNLVQLVSRYTSKTFRFASKNFYASFMAILHAQTYAAEIYRFNPQNEGEGSQFRVVSLKNPIRAKTFSNGSKIDDSQLLSLNRDIKDAFKSNKTLPKGFQLFVPKESVPHLVNKFNVLESSLQL